MGGRPSPFPSLSKGRSSPVRGLHFHRLQVLDETLVPSPALPDPKKGVKERQEGLIQVDRKHSGVHTADFLPLPHRTPVVRSRI